MTVASCNTSRINYGTLLRINLTGAHVASDTDDDDDANDDKDDDDGDDKDDDDIMMVMTKVMMEMMIYSTCVVSRLAVL